MNYRMTWFAPDNYANSNPLGLSHDPCKITLHCTKLQVMKLKYKYNAVQFQEVILAIFIRDVHSVTQCNVT